MLKKGRAALEAALGNFSDVLEEYILEQAQEAADEIRDNGIRGRAHMLRVRYPSNVVSAETLLTEQQRLGSLLLSGTGKEFSWLDGLTEDDFALPGHRVIFRTIRSAIRDSGFTDPIQVMNALRHDSTFEELGGLRYLADLVDYAPPIPKGT